MNELITKKNDNWLKEQQFSYDLKSVVQAFSHKGIDVTREFTMDSSQFSTLLTRFGGVRFTYLHQTIKRLYPMAKYDMSENGEHLISWNPNDVGFDFSVNYKN